MLNFGFIVFFLGFVILQAGLVVRERLYGAAVHAGCGLGGWLERFDEPPIVELSAGQTRFLSALRVVGCIGVVIIWGALIDMLSHLGGPHLAQLWQNDHQTRAMINTLLYTALVLALMRRRAFVWGRESWNPRERLGFHAFMMFDFFFMAFVAIADLIHP